MGKVIKLDENKKRDTSANVMFISYAYDTVQQLTVGDFCGVYTSL